MVGAGLANSLIAMRLKQCHPGLRILMLEAEAQPGGNHCWSFHQSDITPAQHNWLKPLVAHCWQGYQVRFPAFTRSLAGGYNMISSERLARVMRGVLKEALWTQTAVSHLTPQSVTLADGQRLMADVVIDGRGWQPAAPFHTESQAFLGQAWRLREPHGMSQPVLMDATVTQHGGYHFVYTLPLSEHTLFIEDTHYINGTVFNSRQARENIACYAAANQWQLMAMEREEQGCLPITLGGCHHQVLATKSGSAL